MAKTHVLIVGGGAAGIMAQLLPEEMVRILQY